MIILNDNWTFTAEPEDLRLGYVGENKVYTLLLQINGTTFADWSFFMDVHINNRIDVWAVNSEEKDGNLLLTIPILQSYISNGRHVRAQLRANASDGRIKKSEQISLYVKKSVNAPLEISLLPSEFEVYENRIISARSEAETAATAAIKSEQAAMDAVAQCERILEDVKASDTWREFGMTPCRFNIEKFGEIKLKSDRTCSYHVYSDTIKDMESQERKYYGNILEDTSRGYYEFTLGSKATAWYSVYFKMILSNLEIGKTYKIYIDTTGLQPGSTSATMMYGQFLLAESVSGNKGNQIMAPTRISSAGLHDYEFVPTTSDIILEYYPGNIVEELVAGYTFRLRDLYVNYADASSEHTSIYDKRGTFTNEITLVDILSPPVHFESDPPCSVWYSRPVSNVFTINGHSPNSDGNVVLPDPPISRLHDKTLVCFGDSITGMFSPPTDYPSVISQLTGMTIYNVGMEGCRMSHHPSQYYDSFSMYQLAKSIVANDYTLQEAAVGHVGSYAPERINTLKTINWTNVDFVTVMYGTNDVQGGVSLDNIEDPKDITTYLGAARFSLETLWRRYPHLQVLLLTPIYRYWNEEQIDSDEKMFGNKHFYEFGEALTKLAKCYKTPVLDLYYELGINKFNRTHYFPDNDGTHPNESGRRMIGSKITGYLLSAY